MYLPLEAFTSDSGDKPGLRMPPSASKEIPVGAFEITILSSEIYVPAETAFLLELILMTAV
jgi:hypothetical protein